MAMRLLRSVALVAVALLAALPAAAGAQNPATISGTIKNDAGLPVGFAQIFVDELGIGATTRENGKYTLFIPASRVTGQQVTVSVRAIGYKLGSAKITLRAGILTQDFTLEANPFHLGEVVITGAGTQTTNEKLGNVITTVKADAIDKSQEMNLVTALAAKAPNVVINQSSGDPGAATFMQIRGVNTIQGSNQPLIVIDGIPVDNTTNVTAGDVTAGTVAPNRAVDINPADIESIDILSGAAAGAIYGARAGAGVILITTKRGRPGETRYNLRSSMSFDKVDKLPSLQRVYGQGSVAGPAVCGGPGCQLTGNSWGPLIPAGTPTYDHAGELFQQGQTYDNTLSVSGGDDRTSFYLSLGRLSQDGIIKGPNNAFTRNTALLKGTQVVNSRVRLGAAINFSDVHMDAIQRGSNVSGLLLGGWRTTPTFNSAYYIDSATGTQRSYRYPEPISASDYSTRIYDNPFWTLNKNKSTSDVGRILGSVNADYTPIPWLDIKYTLGGDYYSDERLEPTVPSSSAQPLGRIFSATYTGLQINSDLLATASHTFSPDVSGTFGIGQNLSGESYRQLQVQGQKFIVPDQLQLNNTTDFIPNDYESLVRSRSFFFTGSLDLHNQLYLQALARNDAFSTFGKSARSAWFPKASASWVFTNAMQTSNDGLLNSGKLRVAYGVTGTSPLVYQIFSGYNTANLTDNWGPFLTPTQDGTGGLTSSGVKPQPDLKPERNAEFETGVDLVTLANKVDLSLTYYKRKSTQVIFNLPLPASTGYTSQAQNAGTIENKGFEVSTNWRAINTPNLAWEIGAQLGQNNNMVTELKGADFVYYGGTTGFGFDPVAMKGHPIGSWYDRDLARCHYGETDNIVGGIDINAVCSAAGAPDKALYIGTDGFPLGDDKQRIVGNPWPRWTASVTTSLTLNKKWRVSALVDIRHGGKNWNGTRGALDNFGVAGETLDRDKTIVFGRDIAKGPTVGPGVGTPIDFGAVDAAAGETYAQEWYQGLGSSFTGYGAQFLEDAGFVKLREVSVARTFDGDWVHKVLGAQSIDVRLSGRNLWMHSTYTGIDPEANLTGTDPSRGLDWFGNPMTKSFALTFSLNR